MDHVKTWIMQWIDPCIAYGGVIVKAYVAAFLFTHLLFQPVIVQGNSMYPTYVDGTIGLSNIMNRHMHGLKRFDVVLFKGPDEALWVKRVIALPQETIEVRNNVLSINGVQVEQPFLKEDVHTYDFGPITMKENEVFVMGDHREDSYDSRSIGGISTSSIVSKDLYPIYE